MINDGRAAYPVHFTVVLSKACEIPVDELLIVPMTWSRR
jgi:hypothetical protein